MQSGVMVGQVKKEVIRTRLGSLSQIPVAPQKDVFEAHDNLWFSDFR